MKTFCHPERGAHRLASHSMTCRERDLTGSNACSRVEQCLWADPSLASSLGMAKGGAKCQS